MKKELLISLLFVSLLGCAGKVESSTKTSSSISSTITLTSSTSEKKDYYSDVRENVDEVCYQELKGCFDFFYDTANTVKNSPAYGLIPDRYNTRSLSSGAFSSIASIGYGLASLPIGVENGYVSYEEAYDRAENTIYNLLQLERVHGFYYHFLDMKSGKRFGTTELSIIDTAILTCGALTAGKYFGGKAEEYSQILYQSIEWDWYYNKDGYYFYMGYSPEKGFEGSWNGYAEQLMIHVLAAGSDKYKVDKDAYSVMKAKSKLAARTPYYDKFYMTYTGSLFTYQFSHSFIDFRNIVDEQGVNWFDNSVNASIASRLYAIDKANLYKTYGPNSWGFTACDGPNGYSGAYGSAPNSGGSTFIDGTVPPCGAIGSIVFTPSEAIEAMKHYKNDEKLWSKFGFVDAYNLGTTDIHSDPSIDSKVGSNGWYASDVIGIDKGVSALMIENYISGLVWNIFMDIDCVQKGLTELGFKER